MGTKKIIHTRRKSGREALRRKEQRVEAARLKGLLSRMKDLDSLLHIRWGCFLPPSHFLRARPDEFQKMKYATVK